MKTKAFKISTLFAAVVLSSGSAWAEGRLGSSSLTRVDGPASTASACVDLRSELIDAAEGFGISINTDQIVTATADGLVFAGTSIAGFERIPAPQFSNGANVGFIYLSAPASGIPTGFYILNARANSADIRVGAYDGTVGFIDQRGHEVVRLNALFESTSLENPAPVPSSPPRMSTQIRSAFGPLKGKMYSDSLVVNYAGSSVIWLPVVVSATAGSGGTGGNG